MHYLALGISVIVGLMIGSGIFVSAGPIFAYTNSVAMSFAVWALGGFLSLAGALCYAELGALLPGNGGEYAYLLEAYGRFPALAFVWISITILRTGSVAILSSVCGRYLFRLIGPAKGSSSSWHWTHDATHQTLWVEKGISVGMLLLGILLVSVSSKFTSKLHNAFLVVKLVAILMIGCLGAWVYWRGTGQGPLVRGVTSAPSTHPQSFLLALQSALWGYDGWNNLSYVGAKVKKPQRNIPRSIWVSVVVVLLAYLFCNFGYFVVLPESDLREDHGMAMEFGEITLGAVGQVLIPIFIILSAFGAMCANLYSSGHLIQTAANQSHFPAFFSHVHPVSGTPIRAMLFLGLFSLPMILSSGLMELIHLNSFASYVFYGITVSGLFILRYYSPMWKYAPRPYKVWPITAVLFLMVSSWMVVSSVLQDLLHAVYLLVWICFGFLCWSIQLLITRWHERHAYSSTLPTSLGPDDVELIQPSSS